MTPRQLLTLAWIVMILLALTGAIQMAGPQQLGLSPVQFAWVGILASALGVVQSFLPPLTRSSEPPTAAKGRGR